MELIFWGATEDVTGSLTFVRLPEGIIAIDAGLYQGSAEAEKLNDLGLPIAPAELEAIILTHAHLDHSGLLPRLVAKGFKGAVYCTRPTAHLVKIILEDSAGLDPGSSPADVGTILKLLRPIDWQETLAIAGGQFQLFPAGHILGASSVKLSANGKSVIFSGDLGRKDDPLIPGPLPCPAADAVVMESTYGGRRRNGDLEKELYTFLLKISRENRVGLIASFAVARGQLLLTLIHEFFQRHPEEKIRVVFDGPMMAAANAVYQRFSHLTKLPAALKESLSSVESIDFPRQWESLSRKSGPLLVVSSSGMLTGGRILRHLANWQDDEQAVLFLPGYQAEGTPGREMLNGGRTIMNEGVRIEWRGGVESSEAFSSHADQGELLDWASGLTPATRIFLVHGEARAKEALARKLEARGHKVELPFRAQSINL